MKKNRLNPEEIILCSKESNQSLKVEVRGRDYSKVI